MRSTRHYCSQMLLQCRIILHPFVQKHGLCQNRCMQLFAAFIQCLFLLGADRFLFIFALVCVLRAKTLLTLLIAAVNSSALVTVMTLAKKIGTLEQSIRFYL